MKNYIISILMLCLGCTSMMKAANTDISGMDNIIYVEPLAAMQESQVLVSIKMKNTAAIRGFQFDLYLPEGATAAKTSKGKIISSLTESRLPDEDEHTLSLSEQNDGSIRFLCGSLADETFTGTDGEIATLTINIDAGMANGDYPVLLKKMKLSETDISKYYETESIETTLTVGVPSYTVLDETSTIPPVAASGVNVKVKRTIYANKWNTICLPFTITAEKLTTAFGEGVEVKDFTSWSSEEDDITGDIIGITIGFTDVTAMEANHPYMIKVSSDISEFTVDGVDINPEEEPTKKVGTKKAERGYFIGTYVANTTVPDDDFFVYCNEFHYSAGLTKMKAFRGYFELADVLSNTENSINSISVNNEDITGVSNIVADTPDAEGVYYDLLGHKIEKPAHGVYIENGRKITFK